MKNIKNIIEQKYPPENPNDLWMKDDVLYKSTHKGWTPLTAGGGSSTNGVTSTTWLELKDKRDAGELIPGSLYRITDYNCTTTQENTQSAGHQFDIVLLALSEDKLAEEGWAMMNDNIYDVTFVDGVTKKCYLYITSIVTDVSGTFESWNLIDVDTMLGTTLEDVERGAQAIVNEDVKTIIMTENGGTSSEFLTQPDLSYNYFQNSNLSAWKVWYCLDNDTARFAWADDSIDETTLACITTTGNNKNFYRNKSGDVLGASLPYAWTSLENETKYTRLEEPESGRIAISDIPNGIPASVNITFTPGHEGTGLPNGRGVIYRLIDEWNIDYPCDFKNMQTLVPMDSYGNIDMQNPVSTKYCYAFTDNTSGEPEDLSIMGHAINIKVKPKLIPEGNSVMYFIPGSFFYTNHNEGQICKFSNIAVGIASVTAFINRGNTITILDGSSNVMLQSCGNICIGYDSSNIMLDSVVNSTFGSNCQNIQLANKQNLNYGNGGVELATKDDLN